jgi:hypothetical protein
MQGKRLLEIWLPMPSRCFSHPKLFFFLCKTELRIIIGTEVSRHNLCAHLFPEENNLLSNGK